MLPISSHMDTMYPCLTEAADPLKKLLEAERSASNKQTILSIKGYVLAKCWYSALSLATALPEETSRQKMGYLIVIRFLQLPLIDDVCRFCQWKMTCKICREWAERFFTKFSDNAFGAKPESTLRIGALACIQMAASIWPDTSSDFVYLVIQKSLSVGSLKDSLSLVVYVDTNIALKLMGYCKQMIPDLVQKGRPGAARYMESVAYSFAMAKGLPFTSPVRITAEGKTSFLYKKK